MKYVNVADLHVHTTSSDGAYSIEEIAPMASQAGLEIISITDHDSVSGLDNRDRITSVELIPGVELSAELGAREVHILGYYIDPDNEKLRATLDGLQKMRRERLHAILDKLAETKIDIDPQEVLDIAAGASVGRLHVAELLIDKGHANTLYEVFRNFLGPEGKAFVPKRRFSVYEAIELLHAAGGAAVLAHPGYVFAPSEVRGFAREGLDGIEAYYPRHSAGDTAQALSLAEELDMVATGGSDFHGRRSTEMPIGAVRVSREHVEKLYQRSRRYAAGQIY